MGKFTALDDAVVDQLVTSHLAHIVEAVCSCVQAESIILRGSFARGEGSVVLEDGRVKFLSDYELMVSTRDVRDRERLRILGQTLTAQLGVDTTIVRFFSLAPHVKLPDTIMAYEIQHGGLTLFGKPPLELVSITDPSRIEQWSALRLLLNRLAEALMWTPRASDWEDFRLITKTVLACAEALLAVNGRYHFSYAERGRRFVELAPELSGVGDLARNLPELVKRATAFKLRPERECYEQPIEATWQQVNKACDASFRYVITKYLGLEFDDYAQFPELYRRELLVQRKLTQRYLPLVPAPLSQNLFVSLRYLHDHRRLPLRLIACGNYPAYQIVFSVIPLMFHGAGSDVCGTARRWLGRVMRLGPCRVGEREERRYLQGCTVQAWKDYCYGLWEVV